MDRVRLCLAFGEQAGPPPKEYWVWSLAHWTGWTLEYIRSLSYQDFRDGIDMYQVTKDNHG
jgi:hypothetical protein